MTIIRSLKTHPSLSRPHKRQRPSFRRTDQPPPFQLTYRDQQIIIRVAYYRLLTTHQIEALVFQTTPKPRGLKSQCQRRLQLLYHHGFLNRLQQPVILGEGRKPFIYTLGKQGTKVCSQLLNPYSADVFRNLKHSQSIDPYHVKHDLAISDTWVILDQLVQAQQLQMPYWLPQRFLKSIKQRSQLPTIKVNGKTKYKVPDGYFALQFPHAPGLAHCFYEEDCGTETQTQWTEKVRAYIDFKHSGASHTHFNCHNFRVLIKTISPARLMHLKHWTAQAGGDVMFWFITKDRISIWQPPTLLDAIWQVVNTTGEYPLNLTDTSQLQL